MATSVFITVDTEFMWRHHAAGLAPDTIYERSVEPGGVGLTYQLSQLAAHRLKACFFVDPMPALLYGIAPIARMVATVLAAGQEVQLHCHPAWTAASHGDGGEIRARFNLQHYSLAEQTSIITQARALLVEAGAPMPVAFRAGAYAANEDTLAALRALGFAYDSSYNGCRPAGIAIVGAGIAPIDHGIVEVPVTLVEEAPGRMRPFQICALSADEARAALDHAAAQDHACVTAVSHSFELANRAGTAPNAIHVRRFDALCEVLDARRDVLPTYHFRDLPALPLGRDDRPLAPNLGRRLMRSGEQLWSNWIAERAA